MSGISWPKINTGSRSLASQMEIKFDWLEKDIIPMLSGEKIDNLYDLGSDSYRWRRCYIGSSSSLATTSSIKCYIGSSDKGLHTYSPSLLRISTKNYDLNSFNNIHLDRDYNQVSFPVPTFMGTNSFKNVTSQTTTFFYSSTIYNRYSCLDASTGVFTAPFSGIYEFSFMAGNTFPVYGGTLASYELTLKTSNRNYRLTGLRDVPSAGGYFDLKLTTLADLDKDDTAEMTYYFNAGKSLTVYFFGRFVG